MRLAHAGCVGLVAPLALAACTAPLITADAPKSAERHPIAPYEWHEECAQLEEGDRLEYSFESNEPVDFNIHYHEGSAVVMPIVRDKTTADAGIYVARIAQGYCLMWEAGAAGALLDYRVRLRPARS
jgi:hypothetical protein